MLWEHDGDMHHAWEDDDFTAEAAAGAQRAQPGPDHDRLAVPDNVLWAGARRSS